MIGDSITGQVWINLVVALQRHGYKEWANCGNTRYFYDLKVEDTVEEMLAKGTHALQKDKKLSTFGRETVLTGPFENATWSYWRGFHLVPSMYEWPGYNIYQSQLEYVAQNFDVIILNFGLHYSNGRVKGLRHDMNSVADYLAKFNKKKGQVGFFREVLPQHFYTLNGNGIYPGPDGFPKNVSQAIIKICHPAPRWRNDVLWEVAAEKQVPVQPVFHQMDMHGFHLEGGKRPDCTHFGNKDTWWLASFDSTYMTVAAGMCGWGLLAKSDCENHFPPLYYSTIRNREPDLEGAVHMSSWDWPTQE
eukprot:SM000012S25344  [mRNA]  locus=s12:566050:568059:+ [translate_table: standard]